MALTGCATSSSTLNSELAIGSGSRDRGIGGGHYLPPSLSRAFYAAADEEPPFAPPKPEPSVVSVSRENWEVLAYPIPSDRVEHQPIYTWNPHETTEPARNVGKFPTALSALELSAPTSEDMQILEAVEAPLVALSDIVLFLPRAVFDRPWQTTRTGLMPYRRAPEMRGSIDPLKVQQQRLTPDPASAPQQVPIGDYPPLPSP